MNLNTKFKIADWSRNGREQTYEWTHAKLAWIENGQIQPSLVRTKNAIFSVRNAHFQAKHEFGDGLSPNAMLIFVFSWISHPAMFRQEIQQIKMTTLSFEGSIKGQLVVTMLSPSRKWGISLTPSPFLLLCHIQTSYTTGTKLNSPPTQSLECACPSSTHKPRLIMMPVFLLLNKAMCLPPT